MNDVVAQRVALPGHEAVIDLDEQRDDEHQSEIDHDRCDEQVREGATPERRPGAGRSGR
jgi:hypothetical protein